MSKIILYIRHSIKDESGLSLTQAGIELARKMVDKNWRTFAGSKITDIFTSDMGRTVETALAMVMALGINAKMHPHAEARLAANRAQHERFAKEYENKESYRDLMTSPELVEFSRKAILDMFTVLDEGAFALAVGHAPFVNIGVAVLTNNGMDYLDTKECEGFVLIHNDNGIIEVERYIS